VSELGASSSVAFDASDFDCLDRFFDELMRHIYYVMVIYGGP